MSARRPPTTRAGPLSRTLPADWPPCGPCSPTPIPTSLIARPDTPGRDQPQLPRRRARHRSAALTVSAGGYLDVERRADLGMQPDRNPVRANGLDRVRYFDLSAVELGTAGAAHRGRDVRGRDRAEQPAALASPRLQPHPQAGQPVGCFPGVVKTADLASCPGSLDHLDLVLRAAR